MTSPPVPPPGARFAAARKRLGWTLRDAERASGVSNAHISQIETGAIAQPGPAVVAKLARAYGMGDLIAVTVPTGIIRIEGGKLSETEVEELAERWKAAWRTGEYTVLPDDTEKRIAEAVAAETERCAQLAEQHEAHYHRCEPPCDSDKPEHNMRPFAALLREAQP